MDSIMLFLECFFSTLGPIEVVPNEPCQLGLREKDAAEILCFLFFLFLVIFKLFLDLKRNPELCSSFERPTLSLFFIPFVIVILCIHYHLALCDGRPNSPALEPRAPVSVPPEPPVPPVPIVPPEVPWLDPPLMPDALRRVELQQRLSVYFIGRHDAAHLPQFLGTLEKQVLLERRIEAALVQDGYNPHRIIMQRHEIRGILFNHPTRAVALSERTLDAYINQIERNGTRQSIPYRRVVRAIQNWNLSL